MAPTKALPVFVGDGLFAARKFHHGDTILEGIPLFTPPPPDVTWFWGETVAPDGSKVRLWYDNEHPINKANDAVGTGLMPNACLKLEDTPYLRNKIVAIGDILPGEEILVHYGALFWHPRGRRALSDADSMCSVEMLCRAFCIEQGLPPPWWLHLETMRREAS